MTLGTIDGDDGRVVFRYRRHLRHPVDTVWTAITDPDAIASWMGTRPELDLRPGGRYVTHHQGGDRVVDRVLRVQPPELFEHTFFEHVNPDAVVTWRLHSEPAGTLLELTHAMSHDDLRAAADGPAAGDDLVTILARNGAGWHRLLDVVEAFLGGGAPGPVDWASAQQPYTEQAKSLSLP